ncbi:hypothetical protein K440DRAFT_632147 [Wilcoxina mikolae CBS 423.85]|nr:hypothetical protein K440DRAFT_632147 [Wilcoxina mikolae CBS 423.85]
MLVLYDVVVFVEDGSPQKYAIVKDWDTEAQEKEFHERAELERTTRILTIKQTVKRICEVYDYANVSGLTVRFFNQNRGRKNVTPSKCDFLDGLKLQGLLRFGTELKRKILDPFVGQDCQMEKPLLVIVLASGEVEGEKTGLLEHVIINCLANCVADPEKGRGVVEFQFAQVGRDIDQAATSLRNLDNDVRVGDRVSCLLRPGLDGIGDPGLKWQIVYHGYCSARSQVIGTMPLSLWAMLIMDFLSTILRMS